MLPVALCCIPGAATAALQLENSRLREELDSLKRRLPAMGLLRRTSSSIGGQAGGVSSGGAAIEQLALELAQVCLCANTCVGCWGLHAVISSREEGCGTNVVLSLRASKTTLDTAGRQRVCLFDAIGLCGQLLQRACCNPWQHHG